MKTIYLLFFICFVSCDLENRKYSFEEVVEEINKYNVDSAFNDRQEALAVKYANDLYIMNKGDRANFPWIFKLSFGEEEVLKFIPYKNIFLVITHIGIMPKYDYIDFNNYVYIVDKDRNKQVLKNHDGKKLEVEKIIVSYNVLYILTENRELYQYSNDADFIFDATPNFLAGGMSYYNFCFRATNNRSECVNLIENLINTNVKDIEIQNDKLEITYYE